MDEIKLLQNFLSRAVSKLFNLNFNWYDPEYMGTIADWVSGIGTLIAVIVTLYFSTRDNRKRLSVSGSWSYVVYNGGNLSSDGLITVEAVNLGKIPVHISNVGLIKRKRPKRLTRILEKCCPKSFVKMQFIEFSELSSDTTPTVIDAQESKTFRGNMTSTELRNHKHTSRKMRLYVEDSTGRFYYSKKIKI